MAKSTKGGGSTITRNLSEIDTQIKKINASFKEGKTSAAEFTRALKTDPTNTALQEGYKESLKRTITSLNELIEAYNRKKTVILESNKADVKNTDELQRLDEQLSLTTSRLNTYKTLLEAQTQSEEKATEQEEEHKKAVVTLGDVYNKITGYVRTYVSALRSTISTISNVITSFASTATEIDTAMMKFNISSETYQLQSNAWARLTNDASAYTEVMDNAVSIMSKVSTGNQKIITDLGNIGLTVDDLSGLTSTEVVDKIIDALRNMEDQSKLTERAVALFGQTTGTYVAAMVNTSSSQIAEWNEQMEEAGLLTQEEVDNGVELNDKLAYLEQTIKTLVADVGTDLIPLFDSFANIVKTLAPALEAVADGLSAIGPGAVAAIAAVTPLIAVLPQMVAWLLAAHAGAGNVAGALAGLAAVGVIVGGIAAIAGNSFAGSSVSNASIASGTLSAATDSATSNTYDNSTSNNSNTIIDNSTINVSVDNETSIDDIVAALNARHRTLLGG